MVVANSAQIREMDRIMMEEFDFPGLLLMETAGRKSAEFLLETYPNQNNFLVLCGPGNNGGDGLVVARYLHNAGKQVQILLSHSPGKYKNDASTNFGIVHKQGVPYEVFDAMNAEEIRKFLSEGTIIIDALLGTASAANWRLPSTKSSPTSAKRPMPSSRSTCPPALSATPAPSFRNPCAASIR